MQRTVTPSGKPYIGSNPIPSTIVAVFTNIPSVAVFTNIPRISHFMTKSLSKVLVKSESLIPYQRLTVGKFFTFSDTKTDTY